MINRSLFNQFTFTLAFLGLCSQAPASPHHRLIPSEQPAGATACTYPDGTSPQGQAELHCYDPALFLRAYGIDKLHEKGITGKGQTIILVDSFGSPTMQADLDHFSDTFGLPRTTIQFIYPDGPYVNPVSDGDQIGWAQETTLDLEWAHTVAPDATLVNIISNTSETTGLNGFPDLFAGIQMAIKQYPGAIVSMSFGTGEPTFVDSDVKTYLQGSFHQILKQAVAAGMTLLASAGDSGSTNINADETSLVASDNASYPATDPLITAVGGTAIEAGWLWTPQGTADDYWNCQLANNAACPTDFFNSVEAPGKVKESVWKEDWAVAAGGGGVSTIFSAPKFQSEATEHIKSLVAGQRAIPDVAMNAAINGGVEVYTSFVSPANGITGPAWQSFGGTSCASPETAGLVALAAQKVADKLGKNVGMGFLNPLLYSIDNDDFNDIVSESYGTNLQVVIDNNALYFNPAVLAVVGPTRIPPVAVPGYLTTKKYDLATGRGSPKAVNFVQDLARARLNQLSNQ